MQLVHALENETEYCPTVQEPVAAVRPVVPQNVPAEQEVQLDNEPMLGW